MPTRHDPECNPALTEKRLDDHERDIRALQELMAEIKNLLSRLDERMSLLLWFNRGVGGSIGAGVVLFFHWLLGSK